MIAFWLLPAPAERAVFAALIRDFAQRCDGPVFEPHLTLGGGELEVKLASEMFAKLLPAAPLALEIEQIGWSAEYTKTLFVGFRRTAAVDALSRASGGGGEEFQPHLSLLYAHLPAARKAELASEISLPFHPRPLQRRADDSHGISPNERCASRSLANARDRSAFRMMRA